MVKPFENKAFDLLKSPVHAAKIGLGLSKTFHSPFFSTKMVLKKKATKPETPDDRGPATDS
ncbi:MAG: hypothetical protein EWV40_11120 [Microcystis flos-aquae Mf_WU_F_19750830_S460]|uniref:Uncharacterized protein n=1 Tax=Microcystis flos-aquae Mf_WU_F_19750830_S460 TaxID=2486237 RepID=A0A552LNM9_9CHRO|nr:MAG: hypothetical protein EWV40_11120 [Microcystis flos-aquae Mf_WU_F_19750830_S460]